MLPNIVILTFLGLVTSVMLKVLNSVWKAVATAVELFITSYASALVFGYAVHFSDLVALCIAAAGVSLYALGARSAGGTGSGRTVRTGTEMTNRVAASNPEPEESKDMVEGDARQHDGCWR